MRNHSAIFLLSVALFLNLFSFAQSDSPAKTNDSLNAINLQIYTSKLAEIEEQRLADSIARAGLELQLSSLKTTDNLKKEDLLRQLEEIKLKEKQSIADKKQRIDSLRSKATGYPVFGVLKDTLFLIYTKIGALSPKERASNVSGKIRKLYNDDFLKTDSLMVVKSEFTYDIVYRENIIMSVSETDALWYNKTMFELANEFNLIIRNSIVKAREENSIQKLLLRIGLVILVLVIAWFIIKLIGKANVWLFNYIELKKDHLIRDLSYKDYTFLTAEQEMRTIVLLMKVVRWFTYALLAYITLPVIFSIFPFSRNWADTLFHLIWSPFKGVLIAVWNYMPNLFSILVIYYVMKYFIRFVRYIFSEIESEKLKISGFHADWAMPTFSIVKFLLYAFMFVLIFPYLPGSDSNIFKGVSVFIGVLFSLGSSTAIANMVAGLVITYMRPFKIGDRIKIGEISGDVMEKTLLVTRLKTVKNEVITIPNSSILSGNTVNYSSEALTTGLILHTTVTIGYDIPWKLMHQTLLNAAERTEMLQKEPQPFVLQTSLDDFYVSYQLNVYTKEASKQAAIYSLLHQNIQDCCNEAGIEILSPHYRAARDGNATTIPANYLDKDYKAPNFNINVHKD